MKTVKRDIYGYRRQHQFRLMASDILLGLMMYFLFMLSLRISRLLSTILTIFIVLVVIPLSLTIVMSLIVSRVEIPSEERHVYAQRTEDHGILLYDYIFATKRIGFPVDFLLIADGECYTQSCGNAAQQAELKQHPEHYTTVGCIGFKIVLDYNDKGFLEAVDSLSHFLLDALPEERREKVLKCERILLGLPF